jgi:nitric oxide dioxygenase
MPNPLSPDTIAIVKATAPAVAEHAQQITSRMYELLFQDEHIRALFNQSNQGEKGTQIQALAAAIVAYARNIDNLGALGPIAERIAQKHIGYHILPEHYPYVAQALLTAISDVLSSAASEEILNAWGKAYWFLADLLKDREYQIRAEISSEAGGWNGWRKFIVTDKKQESAVITSFILRPEDGKPVLQHKPGQYLTFRFGHTGLPLMKRNYSISCGPNNEDYRISVKREEEGQGGSRHLHDVIDVGDIVEATPPAGDFFLPEAPSRPVVLLSAGVGLTPMVSMIEKIAVDHPELETHFVHAALNSATHAMDQHVRHTAKAHGKMTVTTFYSEPGDRDAAGLTHDFTGFITVDWLKQHAPIYEADIYLCGPKPFLRSLVASLKLAGVPMERVHFELFGPTDEDIAA